MESRSVTTIKDRAYENDRQIRLLKKGLQGSFIELAKLLHENREYKYYEDLDYVTFEQYIASPELSFERRTVYSLIAIYERFVLEYHVQPVALLEADYSKLDRILRVTTPENYEEWFDKAKSLSRSDLEEEIREYQVSQGLEVKERPMDSLPLSHYLDLATNAEKNEVVLDTPKGQFRLTMLKEASMEEAVTYGNRAVNDLMDYWKEVFGASKLQPKDRYAMFNLLRAKYIAEMMSTIPDPVERVKKLIDVAFAIQRDRYAPRVSSPQDLFHSVNKIKNYVMTKREGNNGTTVAKVR